MCSPAEFRMLKLYSPGKRSYLTKMETDCEELKVLTETKNTSLEALSATMVGLGVGV